MKVIGGLATIPSRSHTLQRVVDSIVPWVDILHIALNGYTEVPEWLLPYRNVKTTLTDNRLGDAYKFLGCEVKETYFCTFDDDLIINKAHVGRLIDGVDKYKGVCSYHGRIYPTCPESFLKWTANYRCLNTVPADVQVNFLGTGCACFSTEHLQITMDMFEEPNMADIWLAKAAHEQGVPMYVLKHGKDFFTYIRPNDTIWKSNTVSSITKQTAVLKSFLK
jgi:hypothetical protein